MNFFGPQFNYKQMLPKQYLDSLNQYDPREFIKMGLGAAGRQARDLSRKIKDGEDVSSYMGPELASLNAQAARAKETSGRRIMGQTRFSAQPFIASRIAATNAADIEQRKDENVAGAARGLRTEAWQTFMQAKALRDAQRRAAAELELAKRRAAAEAYLGGLKAPTGGSIFGQLLKGGLALGSMAIPGGGTIAGAAAGKVLGA